MPAPTQLLIKANIVTALLAKGYVKRIVQDGAIIEVPGVLPEELDKMVDAISTGVANTWTTWQASQTVTGACATPSGAGTISGNLP